jgi:hypothetical protein
VATGEVGGGALGCKGFLQGGVGDAEACQVVTGLQEVARGPMWLHVRLTPAGSLLTPPAGPGHSTAEMLLLCPLPGMQHCSGWVCQCRVLHDPGHVAAYKTSLHFQSNIHMMRSACLCTVQVTVAAS